MSKSGKNFIDELKKNKIKKKIIDIILSLKKEKFFDPAYKKNAYQLEPIPIGKGQYSDDPIILAKMIQYLDIKKKSRILEVGTGSGYSTAILASIASEVITIDYHEELARSAKEVLTGMKLNNIRFFAGDASEIDFGMGKFDSIIILCGCIMRPITILDMLEENGTAVFPMGTPYQQQLILYKNIARCSDSLDRIRFLDFCRFNSIRGRYGWEDQDRSLIAEGADTDI